jgi:hypothetical protein
VAIDESSVTTEAAPVAVTVKGSTWIPVTSYPEGGWPLPETVGRTGNSASVFSDAIETATLTKEGVTVTTEVGPLALINLTGSEIASDVRIEERLTMASAWMLARTVSGPDTVTLAGVTTLCA